MNELPITIGNEADKAQRIVLERSAHYPFSVPKSGRSWLIADTRRDFVLAEADRSQ
jgi:hypothetical protein